MMPQPETAPLPASVRRQIRQQLKHGRLPAEVRIQPTESLSEYIDQLGIGPGPVKLAQFKAALAMRGTPALCAQDGKADDAIVHVKLFDPCGSATWYLTEWDGQDEVFGFVTGLGTDELGYASLNELATLRGRLGIGIEIDTHFYPRSLAQTRAV
jgi:hypothetical protein